jgi:S1-C subfamily serine protease
MARRARFVLAVLRDLADRDAPPPFQADGAPDPGVLALAASPLELRALGGTGGPGAGAGAGPAGALKVGAVIAGRAAHRADLRPGDFVVAIDGRRLDQDAGKETLKEAFQAASGPLDLTVVRGSRRLLISLAPDPPAAPPAGP